jgi:bifunctional UDP-N-acetylglucosamine pyrophosphorylase/glucosamine-1-phosphate N-acetyltransferase
MTDANLVVIVLAAGAGTRMKSSKPKILHSLAGIPLVGHVLATARALEPSQVIAVVRHER